MKYEILKDKEDLYVLAINSVVVLISRDITKITAEIQNDAANRKKSPRRVYESAVIDPNSLQKEPETDKVAPSKENLTLGRLFEL